MGARPLLITGGGSTDVRSVSRGPRGRGTQTLSCQVSWSSSVRNFFLSPWKPSGPPPYTVIRGWGVTAKSSPSSKPPQGITHFQCLTHTHAPFTSQLLQVSTFVVFFCLFVLKKGEDPFNCFWPHVWAMLRLTNKILLWEMIRKGSHESDGEEKNGKNRSKQQTLPESLKVNQKMLLNL